MSLLPTTKTKPQTACSSRPASRSSAAFRLWTIWPSMSPKLPASARKRKWPAPSARALRCSSATWKPPSARTKSPASNPAPTPTSLVASASGSRTALSLTSQSTPTTARPLARSTRQQPHRSPRTTFRTCSRASTPRPARFRPTASSADRRSSASSPRSPALSLLRRMSPARSAC